MKVYAIKNKDGYYFINTFSWSKQPVYAYVSDNEKDLEIVLKDCKDCTIVPITICEGNLEEENRVIKKALKLACEELETRDEGKTHARLFIQKIKNNYLGDNVGYEDYFIQQAKESEKDD